MAAAASLTELYAEEMQDLWSANDQMARAVQAMAGRAHDAKLKTTLEQSVAGIQKHSTSLQALIKEAGGDVKPDHCRGMEGLAQEALKHTTDGAPTNGELLDIEIIAQYQRMSHYGIAGFGSAAAYASALGMKQQVEKLKSIVSDIYQADEYATKLSEKAMSIAPKQD